jgi:hypothetical protein
VAIAVGVAVGCGDDEGTNNNTEQLTTAEKTALTNALATTEFGGLATFVIQAVGAVGRLDASTLNSALQTAFDEAISLSVAGSQAASYEGAVGIALEFDYSLQGETFAGWFYGVFGWNDINTSTNSVGEWVIVGAAGESGSLPSSVSGDIDDLNMFAEYFLSNSLYYATSGSGSIGGSFGGSGTDCGASQSGITIDCNYQTGTMNGNFSFMAEAFTGGDTYEQTPVSFSGLPAVKMDLVVSD